MDTKDVVYIYAIGFQNQSPQDVPLWYMNYFELKETETLGAQEKLLLLLNCSEKFKLGAFLIISLSEIIFLTYLYVWAYYSLLNICSYQPEMTFLPSEATRYLTSSLVQIAIFSSF